MPVVPSSAQTKYSPGKATPSGVGNRIDDGMGSERTHRDQVVFSVAGDRLNDVHQYSWLDVVDVTSAADVMVLS